MGLDGRNLIIGIVKKGLLSIKKKLSDHSRYQTILHNMRIPQLLYSWGMVFMDSADCGESSSKQSG